MVKRLFCLLLCVLFILPLGGCRTKAGIEFAGKNIWTDPDSIDQTAHIGIQERLEKAITSKDADKLTLGFEPVEDKALIREFQEWLSRMRLSPVSDPQFSYPEGDQIHLLGLWADEEEFFSLSISDSGAMVFSFGMAYSFASFYTIDNFEDIRADYEKLIEEIKEAI